MDGQFMTATEQQHYSELFSKSDVDNTGKVDTSHVRKLFLSSRLPNETLQQIVELCGAARVGHFKRSQFYFALKLIAMAQSGLPLPPSIDKINTGSEVPLPSFYSNWKSDGAPVSDPNRQMEFINPAFIDNAQEQEGVDYDYPPAPIKQQVPAEWIGGSGGVIGIPPPQQNSQRTGNALYQVANSLQVNPQRHQIQLFPPQQNTTTTPPSSPVQKSSSSPFQNSTPPTSPPHTTNQPRVLSRHKSLPSSPRDLPPNIKDLNRHSVDIQGVVPVKLPVKDEGWASFAEEKEEKAEQNNHQQQQQQPSSQPQQQQQQSQRGDEDASWAKFSDQSGGDHPPELQHSVSIPGSEGSVSGDEEVWLISTEQRTYYTNQFQRLQPEPFGLLGGAEAKSFFEKSKLPKQELSIIWQLSDVNKDGTLSLEEFCTAMHLVVLRKHNIPLPDKLPACLVPQVGAPVADAAEALQPINKSSEGKGTTEQTTGTSTTSSTSSGVPQAPRSVTPPAPAPVENNKAAKTKDENWAKFHDSPLPRPPSPSSQSPANFDFASISPDPDHKIFQPIPLHVSPSGNRSVVVEQRARTHSDPIRQDSSSDHEYDVPPPGPPGPILPEKKKRANTITSDSSTPAKIAPPPPIEKSRRGDSLEHVLGSPYSTGSPYSSADTSAALPRPRSRSCTAKLAQHRVALSKGAPKQGSLVESTAEKRGDGDNVPFPWEPPSSPHKIRMRASSLDSSVYRSKFHWIPQKNLGRERTFSETIFESQPFEMKPKVGVNGMEAAQESVGEKSDVKHETGDVSMEPPSFPDVPPPMEPPPPLALSTPPMSAPPPPLRWRSASLDSRTRSRVRLTGNLTKFEVEAIKKSRPQDLSSVPQTNGNKTGAEKDATPMPSFPPIAPPPGIEDIRARSASLDNRLYRRERNSDLAQHLRPSIPPRPGAQQKTYPSQTSKSSSVQSSSRSSSPASSSSHSSSAAEDDDDERNHMVDFADFSQFESLTADSHTPEKQNRVISAQYTPVDSTPRLSPPPPSRPRQQHLEDSCTDRQKSAFLASKERHKSGDELEIGRKREQFANERTRHASAPDPVSSTQESDYDRKSIQAAIRRAKEENTKLSRLNSELQQELKQMMEDRIALETQLERLRPFSSTS